EFPVGVEQTATRVARADGSIGLQQGHVVVFHRNFTVEGADDAVGHAVGQGTQRVAHRHDRFTYGQGVTVANDRRGQAGSFDLDQRDVGGAAGSHDGCVIGIDIIQLHLHAGGTADHVGAGQDITNLADDDAGTGTALHVVAAKPGLGAAHLLGG